MGSHLSEISFSTTDNSFSTLTGAYEPSESSTTNLVPSTSTCLNERPLVDTFLPDGSLESVRLLRTNVLPLS